MYSINVIESTLQHTRQYHTSRNTMRIHYSEQLYYLNKYECPPQMSWETHKQKGTVLSILLLG